MLTDTPRRIQAMIVGFAFVRFRDCTDVRGNHLLGIDNAYNPVNRRTGINPITCLQQKFYAVLLAYFVPALNLSAAKVWSQTIAMNRLERDIKILILLSMSPDLNAAN